MDLSSIATDNGYIKIAALDHRTSLMKILPEDRLQDFKALCANTFSRHISALLVDPEYGTAAINIGKQANIGILLCREESGYTDSPEGRTTSLYEKFTSQRLKELGAAAIKLLLYYNPNAPVAQKQVDIVKQVREETKQSNIPLLLEIVTYPVTGFEYYKGDAIIRSIKDLQMYSDVLKLEYPIDIEVEELESAIPYLVGISQSTERPWVLLSKGMKFDLYKKALRISKDNGAKGFAVGRAVWQEVANYASWEDKVKFIKTTAHDRMIELSNIFAS